MKTSTSKSQTAKAVIGKPDRATPRLTKAKAGRLLAPPLQGPSGAPPEVEVITLPGNEAFQKAWQVLVEEAADDNPFFSPRFLVPAAVHLAPDAPMTLVAIWQTTPSGRKLTGLVPMTAPRRPVLSSLINGGHAGLWVHSLLPFSAPLLSPDRDSAVASVAAFLDWMTARKQRLSTLSLPSLLRGSVACTMLEQELARHGFEIECRNDLPHTRGLDFKPSSLPVGIDRVLVARQAGAVRDALEHALCLDMQRTETDNAHQPILLDINRAAFLRAVVRGFAIEGRMVIVTIDDGMLSASAMVIEGRDSGFLWWIMGKDASNPLVESLLGAAAERMIGKPMVAASVEPLSGLWSSPIFTQTLLVHLGRSA